MSEAQSVQIGRRRYCPGASSGVHALLTAASWVVARLPSQEQRAELIRTLAEARDLVVEVHTKPAAILVRDGDRALVMIPADTRRARSTPWLLRAALRRSPGSPQVVGHRGYSLRFQTAPTHPQFTKLPQQHRLVHVDEPDRLSRLAIPAKVLAAPAVFADRFEDDGVQRIVADGVALVHAKVDDVRHGVRPNRPQARSAACVFIGTSEGWKTGAGRARPVGPPAFARSSRGPAN